MKVLITMVLTFMVGVLANLFTDSLGRRRK